MIQQTQHEPQNSADTRITAELPKSSRGLQKLVENRELLSVASAELRKLSERKDLQTLSGVESSEEFYDLLVQETRFTLAPNNCPVFLLPSIEKGRQALLKMAKSFNTEVSGFVASYYSDTMQAHFLTRYILPDPDRVLTQNPPHLGEQVIHEKTEHFYCLTSALEKSSKFRASLLEQFQDNLSLGDNWQDLYAERVRVIHEVFEECDGEWEMYKRFAEQYPEPGNTLRHIDFHRERTAKQLLVDRNLGSRKEVQDFLTEHLTILDERSQRLLERLFDDQVTTEKIYSHYWHAVVDLTSCLTLPAFEREALINARHYGELIYDLHVHPLIASEALGLAQELSDRRLSFSCEGAVGLVRERDPKQLVNQANHFNREHNRRCIALANFLNQWADFFEDTTRAPDLRLKSFEEAKTLHEAIPGNLIESLVYTPSRFKASTERTLRYISRTLRQIATALITSPRTLADTTERILTDGTTFQKLRVLFGANRDAGLRAGVFAQSPADMNAIRASKILTEGRGCQAEILQVIENPLGQTIAIGTDGYPETRIVTSGLIQSDTLLKDYKIGDLIERRWEILSGVTYDLTTNSKNQYVSYETNQLPHAVIRDNISGEVYWMFPLNEPNPGEQVEFLKLLYQVGPADLVKEETIIDGTPVELLQIPSQRFVSKAEVNSVKEELAQHGLSDEEQRVALLDLRTIYRLSRVLGAKDSAASYGESRFQELIEDHESQMFQDVCLEDIEHYLFASLSVSSRLAFLSAVQFRFKKSLEAVTSEERKSFFAQVLALNPDTMPESEDEVVAALQGYLTDFKDPLRKS